MQTDNPYPGFVSPRDHQRMVRFLERTLTPREARNALSRFSSDSRGRSIEWIVAAAEYEKAPRSTLRLTDEEVFRLLVELAGVDLLADRELRRIIASRCDSRTLERLHNYPSGERGRGGDRSKANGLSHLIRSGRNSSNPKRERTYIRNGTPPGNIA